MTRPAVSGLLVSLVSLTSLGSLVAQSPRADEDWTLALGLFERSLFAEAAERFEKFLGGAVGADAGGAGGADAVAQRARRAEANYRLAVCRIELRETAAAIDALNAAIAAGGEDFRFAVEAGYRLASAQQDLGDFPAARASWQRLTGLVQPDHYLGVAAWFGCGECARELGDDAAAVEAFGTAAEWAAAGGDAAAEYAFFAGYQRGLALLRLGRQADAVVQFEQLIDGHPEHAEFDEVCYLAGDAAYRAGQLERAERAWTRVAAGSARAAEARHGIAWCQADRGDHAAARASFAEVAVAAHGKLVGWRARLEAGRLHQVAGQHREAIEMLTPLSTLAAEQDSAADTSGDRATPVDAALATQPDAAIAEQRTIAELRTRAREIVAAAQLALGDVDAARASFAAVQATVGALDPRGARASFGIAQAHAIAREWREAAAAYQAAAAAAGDDAALCGDAAYGAVVALHELGEFEASEQAAATMLQRVPQHELAGRAAFAIAENRFARGQHDLALSAYDELADDHPQASLARYKAAWCHLLLRDPAAAIERFVVAADDEGLGAAERDEALSLVALAAFEARDHDRALLAADRYVARHPGGLHTARVERIAADVLRQRGEFGAASERLLRAGRAERDPLAVLQITLEHADLAFARGDHEAARQAYASARGRDDALGARALEGLAWCAFELGDDPGCLRLLEEARAHPTIPPDIAAALAELEVSVTFRLERFGDTIAAAERCLAEFPDHAHAARVRFALGKSQGLVGQHAAAQATLRDLAALPTSPDVPRDRLCYELARASELAADPAAALEAYRALAELQDGDDELVGHARCEVAEALLALHEGATSAPDSATSDRIRELLGSVRGPHRARAAYRLGFFERDVCASLPAALLAFETIVALGPDEPLYAEAAFLAGEVALRAERFDVAVALLSRLLEFAPQDPRAARARLYLGEAAVREDDAARAIEALEPLLVVAPGGAVAPIDAGETARAQFWLGRARALRGEHEFAERAFVAATRLSSGEIAAEAQYRLGESRSARGDLDGAVDAFVKLSILYAHEPWVPLGLEHAARTYERLGAPDKAERFWRELLERFPGSPAAPHAKSRVGGD